MIEYGSPDAGIRASRAARSRVSIQPPTGKTLVEQLLEFGTSSWRLLDVGKSSRDEFPLLLEFFAQVETLDIAEFNDYPDIRFDLCAELPEELAERYDIIHCQSVLEHVYNPFNAAHNLFEMLSPNGTLFGYTPWLYPYHCLDGEYEDFWRFAPETFGVLFPTAESIIVRPTRGRVSTAALVLTGRWKSVVEARLPRLGRALSRLAVDGRHAYQSSGYEFIVQK